MSPPRSFIRPRCDPFASAPMDRTPRPGDAPAIFTATVEVLGRRVEAQSSTRASPGIEAMETPGPVRPSQRPWRDPATGACVRTAWRRQKLPTLPLIHTHFDLWGQIAVMSVISGALCLDCVGLPAPGGRSPKARRVGRRSVTQIDVDASWFRPQRDLEP